MQNDLHDAALTMDYRRFQAQCIAVDVYNDVCSDPIINSDDDYQKSKKKEDFDYFDQKPKYDSFFNKNSSDLSNKNYIKRKPMGVISNYKNNESFFPQSNINYRKKPITSSFFN